MTSPTREEYLAALREEICGPCPDRHPRGGCGRPADEPCTIDRNMSPLVEAILSVPESPRIEDYVAALRSCVCPSCRQDAEGNCDWRAHNVCKLDDLVIPVVDVIERTRDRIAKRAAG